MNFLERLLRILVHGMTGTWHLSCAIDGFDNPSYHSPCVKPLILRDEPSD